MTLAKVALPNPTLDDYPWRQPIKVLVDPTAKLLHAMWAEGYRVAAEGLLGSAFSVPNVAAAAWAAERAGQLVTEIDGVTHDRVLSVLRGLLGDAFSNPEVTQADVRATILAAFDGMAKTRADLIARTEIALAAGKGSAAGWKDAGVEYVLISDGDDFDEECQAADGAVWTLAEYDDNVISHPNCTRSASPLTAEEAAAQGVGGETAAAPTPEPGPIGADVARASAVEQGYVFTAGTPEAGGYMDIKTGAPLGMAGVGRMNSLALPDGIGGPNVLLTHSHPDDARIINGPVIDGRSFSVADVRLAITDNLGALRAVSGEWEHQITRPEEGWPKWATVQKLQVKVSKDLNKQLDGLVASAIEAGDRTFVAEIRATAEVNMPHRIWQTLADEYGFPYTRSSRR